ncbi:hypothetical protein JMJ35_008976 [Cladonia borealis]|uniref:Uncharacterized protein n=1 Tax=Cladonia borealis TaxID=184061 RepID=A0AA39QV89_9LECA|nr:hypothetical protein JMJ35_008976 [Cladonia borealis]
MAPKKETMSLTTVMMTPMHTSPSPRSRPQSAASSRDSPISKGGLIKPTPKTVDVPASASHGERPYAPVLPPATDSHERETVEALVGLASTSRQSPATAALTSSFSAVNVASTHNGHHDSYMGNSSEHDHSCNISCQAIRSYDYPANTAHTAGLRKDIRSKDGSSSRARRRRRSNSPGIESPRGHRKPYDGHILKKDTVVGDKPQPPRASSPQNYLQVPQKDAHSVPQKIESKQHHRSQRQRQHLPPQDQSVSPRSQQALPSRSQQPTVHHAQQTNEPRMPNIPPPRTYTADVDGLTVLRHTVSAECVQAAANILDRGMKAIKTDPTFKVFDLPVEAFRVRDEFMEKGYRGLRDFHPPSFEHLKPPVSTVVYEYLPAADPGHATYSTVRTARPELVYVMVALTALHFNNGLITLLAGSHGNKALNRTPVNKWDPFQDVLHPGDALIWRGDLNWLTSPHGGGRAVRDKSIPWLREPSLIRVVDDNDIPTGSAGQEASG